MHTCISLECSNSKLLLAKARDSLNGLCYLLLILLYHKYRRCIFFILWCSEEKPDVFRTTMCLESMTNVFFFYFFPSFFFSFSQVFFLYFLQVKTGKFQVFSCKNYGLLTSIFFRYIHEDDIAIVHRQAY